VTTHKLAESETVLEDDYPLIPSFVYIFDGVFRRYEGWEETTVGRYKKLTNTKEVRRRNLFAHPGARLGDAVEPS
jgi:hypothetical protein